MEDSRLGRSAAACCVTVVVTLLLTLVAMPSMALPLEARADCPEDGLFNVGASRASCASATGNQRASADVTTGVLKVFEFLPESFGSTETAAGYVTQIDFQGVTNPFTVTYALTVNGDIAGVDGEVQATVIGWLGDDDAPTCINDADDCFFNSPIGFGNGNTASANYDTGLFNSPSGSLEIDIFSTGSGSGQILLGSVVELRVDLLVDPAQPTVFFSSHLGAFNVFGAGTTIDFFNTATAGISGLPDGVTFTSPNGFLSAVIPVPAAFWLFGSALGLLGWLKHRS